MESRVRWQAGRACRSLFAILNDFSRSKPDCIHRRIELWRGTSVLGIDGLLAVAEGVRRPDPYTAANLARLAGALNPYADDLARARGSVVDDA